MVIRYYAMRGGGGDRGGGRLFFVHYMLDHVLIFDNKSKTCFT
jgi:hypothetical protein